MSEAKTLWRKNLDKRYISGEDLKLGIEAGKGLRPEMVVTIAKFEDAPAFDQKKQQEIDKTAIWLKEYPSGKMVYKPMLLNVRNGEFLSKEIGEGSDFIDDFATDKPFVLYAQADRRHGFVAKCKKYYPKPTATPENATKILSASASLDDLKTNWGRLSKDEQSLPVIIKLKEDLKTKLS
tara:strand:- start:118 stop:657 length:540 start_codon:yes stop_codon:yes gene_type:complete